MNSEVKIPSWPQWMLAAHLMRGALPGGGIGLSLFSPAGLVGWQTSSRIQVAGLLVIGPGPNDTIH